MGKRYDFAFDIHSPNRVVCSELVFRSYLHQEFDWPRSNRMGRYTMSPDQLALRALEGNGTNQPPLEVVALYRDGRRIDGDPDSLARIMAQWLHWRPSQRTVSSPISGR